MTSRGAAQVLRERIGHEATDALITMMNESNRSMAEEVVRTIGDRFERRVSEEVSAVRVEMHGSLGALRVEMHAGFGALRADMHTGFGELRAAIADGRESAIRWTFLFWVAQLGAIFGMLTYLT